MSGTSKRKPKTGRRAGIGVSCDSAFHRIHPAVNFLYFVIAVGSAMVFMHPVYIGIGIGISLVWLILLRGFRGALGALRLAVPMAALVVILSPLANSRGRTVLFEVLGRTITLEAVQYASLSAGMLFLVIVWFFLYAALMNSDRFLYLFGRIAPAVALVVSMTLHLIPTMQDRLAAIRRARFGLRGTGGSEDKKHNLRTRIGEGLSGMTALLTWSMESAIDTADSMKARGFGSRKRTYFSPFRFDRSDGLALGILAALFAVVFGFHFAGFTRFDVYAGAVGIRGSLADCLVYVAFAVLLSLPVILEVKEKIRWR